MSAPLSLVGGGLANSLIALRLQQRRPDVEFELLERETKLGGNHVWCFHSTDLSPSQHKWIEPLVSRHWDGHEVRFPRHQRQMRGGYSAITSDNLHEVVLEAIGGRAQLGRNLSDEELSALSGHPTIDGRGGEPTPHLGLAFQKFVGLWVRTERPHGLQQPILMDATVDQLDGFRFIYTLPFSETTLHVEDTRYSDGENLNPNQLRDEVLRYCERQGWSVQAVERMETGVLPIVLSGDIEAFWNADPTRNARSGLRAALFHPTTGYSLPDAVRLADRIVELERVDRESLYRTTRDFSIAKWKRDSFYRLLNRMLFKAAEPAQRYRVLERFYRLQEGLVERFYANRLRFVDRLRILSGKPPVPLLKALKCIREQHPE
jgi:lycopene beta-cyclase